MMKMFAVAAGAVVLALAPGAASAQQDDSDDRALCVYDALMAGTDYEVVAQAYLNGGNAEETKDARGRLDKISQTCSDTYKLTQDELAASTDMGIYGATVDYLSEELTVAGVDDAVISKVFDLYDSMSKENADQFLDADWREDANFIGEMDKSLSATGLPQGEYEVAREMLAAQIMSDDAMMNYLMVSLDDEPETATP